MWAKLALPSQCLLHEQALVFICIATAWNSFLGHATVGLLQLKNETDIMIIAFPFSFAEEAAAISQRKQKKSLNV